VEIKITIYLFIYNFSVLIFRIINLKLFLYLIIHILERELFASTVTRECIFRVMANNSAMLPRRNDVGTKNGKRGRELNTELPPCGEEKSPKILKKKNNHVIDCRGRMMITPG
jgi:hypothetical protein